MCKEPYLYAQWEFLWIPVLYIPLACLRWLISPFWQMKENLHIKVEYMLKGLMGILRFLCWVTIHVHKHNSQDLQLFIVSDKGKSAEDLLCFLKTLQLLLLYQILFLLQLSALHGMKLLLKVIIMCLQDILQLIINLEWSHPSSKSTQERNYLYFIAKVWESSMTCQKPWTWPCRPGLTSLLWSSGQRSFFFTTATELN